MTHTSTAPVYVFGIVPAGAQLPVAGEHELTQQLRLIEHDGLAAVAGTVPSGRALGRAADLLAHDRVLGELVASGVPVLPMRFGAVLVDDAAVAEELLAGNQASLTAELATVTGRVQYMVQVDYLEDVAVREAAALDNRIAKLRAAAGYDDQLRLGELVVRGIERRRPADAQALLALLEQFGTVRTRETSSPLQVIAAAVLVSDADVSRFTGAVDQLAAEHADRMHVRLIGPSPAYDFVGSH